MIRMTTFAFNRFQFYGHFANPWLNYTANPLFRNKMRVFRFFHVDTALCLASPNVLVWPTLHSASSGARIIHRLCLLGSGEGKKKTKIADFPLCSDTATFTFLSSEKTD